MPNRVAPVARRPASSADYTACSMSTAVDAQVDKIRLDADYVHTAILPTTNPEYELSIAALVEPANPAIGSEEAAKDSVGLARQPVEIGNSDHTNEIAGTEKATVPILCPSCHVVAG